MGQLIKGRRSEDSAIFISTAGSAAVNKDIFCCSAIDICVKGNPTYAAGAWTMNERDILQTTYKNLVHALNFTSYKFSDGSTSDHAQVIPDETRITGGDGAGYNCVAPDCGSGSILTGICCVADIDQDFFLATTELARLDTANGAKRIDLTINVQLSAPDWIEQAEWMIEHTTNQGVAPKHAFLGLEQVLEGNDAFWGFPSGCQNETDYFVKAQNYLAKINPTLGTWRENYPGITFHGDAQRPEAMSDEGATKGKRCKAWNNVLQGLNCQAMRTYFNSGDLDWELDDDFEFNLLECDRMITETIPFRLRQMRFIHKGKLLSIPQWGFQSFGAGATTINGTMLAILYICRKVKFMLDFNYRTGNLITYASYQNLKQLINNSDVPTAHYYAMLACGKMFLGTPYYCLTIFNIPGVHITVTRDNVTGMFRMKLINENSTTRNFPKVVVNNTSFTFFSSRFTVYASDLDSTTILTESAINETGISARANSVNIITFSIS